MKTLYSFLSVAVMSVSVFAQTTLLSDNFSTITAGNDTTTTGSGTQWTGNASFPTINAAYQAGGVVRLGTSSLNGSMRSNPLDLSLNNGNFKVEFDVKGWTTVEGAVSVSVTGLPTQTYSYSSAMGDTYEHVTLDFIGGTANSTVTFATTTKRAFIDNVIITSSPTILAVGDANAVRASLVKNTSVSNTIFFAAKSHVQIINVNGQVVKSAFVNENTSLDIASLPKGIYIVRGNINGKKVSQKIIKK